MVFRSPAERQHQLLVLFKMLVSLSGKKDGLGKRVLDEPAVRLGDDVA